MTLEEIVLFAIACCLTAIILIACIVVVAYVNIFASWYRYDQSRAKFKHTERKFN